MIGPLRRLSPALLLGAALLATGCEDNEHPFGDAWAVGCSAEGMPGLAVSFREEGHLDDGGRRRSYLGRVRLDLPEGVAHYWVWQVEVNVHNDTAETVLLEPVPIPDAYLDDVEPLTLDVETFVEAEDTASATMLGTCGWGDARGELTLQQSDDCDVCDAIECSTLSGTPLLGLAAWGGLLLWRRRRQD